MEDFSFNESSQTPEEYRQALERALENARFEEDDNQASRILLDLGFLFLQNQQLEEAAEYFEEGLRYLKSTNQHAACVRPLRELAVLYRKRHEIAKAYAAYTDLADYAEKTWERELQILALREKARILIEEKSAENGLKLLFQSVEIAITMKFPVQQDILQEIRNLKRAMPPGTVELAVHRWVINPHIKNILKQI